MAKQFLFRNLLHSKYNTVKWEEELELPKEILDRALSLEIGEVCKSNSPFIEIERVIDTE